jgi:hypothetical protein
VDRVTQVDQEAQAEHLLFHQEHNLLALLAQQVVVVVVLQTKAVAVGVAVVEHQELHGL